MPSRNKKTVLVGTTTYFTMSESRNKVENNGVAKCPFQGIYLYTPNEPVQNEQNMLAAIENHNDNQESDSCCSYLISSDDDNSNNSITNKGENHELDVELDMSENESNYAYSTTKDSDDNSSNDEFVVIDAQVSLAHSGTRVLPATTVIDEDFSQPEPADASYRKHGWIGIGLIVFSTTIALIGIGIWQRQLDGPQSGVATNDSINAFVPSPSPLPILTPTTAATPEPLPWESLGDYHESLLQTVLETLEAFHRPVELFDVYAWTTRGTPQFKALRFVAYQDGGVDGGGDMGYYDGRSATPLLLQRLALLVLYYSTGGEFSWTTIASMSSPSLSTFEDDHDHDHDDDDDVDDHYHSLASNFIPNPEDWATPGVDECLWSGVVCDPENYRVTHIQLKENGLVDRIPIEFWAWLPHLFHVDLSNNQLTGKLPYTFFWPETSADLSSSSSSFSQQAYLTELNHLDMSFNNLEGTLPQNLQGGQLLSLQVLNLGHNRFTGRLPTHYDKQTLEQLVLSNNKFTGTLPFDHWFGEDTASSLFWVHLGNNLLTGSIPDSLGNHRFLEFLSIQNNPLMQGRLPSISVLRKLTNLEILDLSDCGLHGSLTIAMASLLGLPKLKRLSLSENQLTGSLPTSEQIEADARMTSTNLSRSVLQALNLGNNGISGTLPPDLFGQRLVALEHLQLFGNDLHGQIPTSSFDSTNLQVFWIQNNVRLEGTMPCDSIEEVIRNDEDMAFLQDFRADCWFSSSVTCTCCTRCF